MSHGVEVVEFGFVAALEREVSGLVRGWEQMDAGEGRKIFRQESAALITAGTGVEQAYRAARLLVERCAPRVLVSVGFAGSCMAGLEPGSIVIPAQAVEAKGGGATECGLPGSSGVLVTLDRVAGRVEKQQLRERFAAMAVDMEAAGVARAAGESGVEFAAIKAISDGAEDDLDFLANFVTPEGFATARFVAHIAPRPWMWSRVVALGRNSRKASEALDAALRQCIRNVARDATVPSVRKESR